MIKKQSSIVLFAAIALLFSCSSPTDHQSIQISKASAFSSKTSKASEQVAFIYDYNPNRSKLEWKARKIAESSGDTLFDALHAFIAQNIEKGLCTSFEVEKIDESKQPVVITFSGKPEFKNKKDQKIFWTAMDMTISRNAEAEDFKLAFK